MIPSLPSDTPLWIIILIMGATAIWGFVSKRTEEYSKASLERSKRTLDADLDDRKREQLRDERIMDAWKSQSDALASALREQGATLVRMVAEMEALRRSSDETRQIDQRMQTALVALVDRMPNLNEIMQPMREMSSQVQRHNGEIDAAFAQIRAILEALQQQKITVPQLPSARRKERKTVNTEQSHDDSH